jgi:hypothetical protein
MRYIGVEIVIADGRYFAYSKPSSWSLSPDFIAPRHRGHLIIDEIPLGPELYRGTLANSWPVFVSNFGRMA